MAAETTETKEIFRIKVEQQPDNLAIALPELKRLIAEWNREEVRMSLEHGYNIAGKKTDVSKLVEYILDGNLRREKELEDESAMKASIFLEWAERNNRSIFKRTEPKTHKAAA